MCKLRTLIEQTIYAQRPHAIDLCNLYVYGSIQIVLNFAFNSALACTVLSS